MSDETTPDLTALLAEHAPTYTEHANDPTTTFYCKTCSDAAGDWVTWTPAHLAEQITAAGFGPVRAVEAERDDWKATAWGVTDLVEGITARAESAEAALTGVVAGVRKWCAINEIAEPPLDWAGLGEFLDRAPTPDREEARDE